MNRLQAMVGAERTGKYDAQTVAKIMAFQTRLGLKGKDVDGIYGPGTRKALKNSRISPEKAYAMAAGSADGGGVGRAKIASKRNRKKDLP